MAVTSPVQAARKQLSGRKQPSAGYFSEGGRKPNSTRRQQAPVSAGAGRHAAVSSVTRERAASATRRAPTYARNVAAAPRATRDVAATVTRPAKAYSGTLLAEYLAAAAIISLGVMVGQESYTVKMARALTRLGALTAVFFVLALLASGENSGKFAATFGLLIDVAVLFDSSKQGHLKAAAQSFAGLNTPESPDDTGGGGGGGGTAHVASFDDLDALEKSATSVLGV